MKTWREIEELSNRPALVRLIEEHGTAPRIARHLGCSVNSVRGAMQFHALKARNWRPKGETKNNWELK